MIGNEKQQQFYGVFCGFVCFCCALLLCVQAAIFPRKLGGEASQILSGGALVATPHQVRSHERKLGERPICRETFAPRHVCWSILWNLGGMSLTLLPQKKVQKDSKTCFFCSTPLRVVYISESEGESVDIFFLRFLRLKLFKGDIIQFVFNRVTRMVHGYCC